jgi:hypothetical protein
MWSKVTICWGGDAAQFSLVGLVDRCHLVLALCDCNLCYVCRSSSQIWLLFSFRFDLFRSG